MTDNQTELHAMGDDGVTGSETVGKTCSAAIRSICRNSSNVDVGKITIPSEGKGKSGRRKVPPRWLHVCAREAGKLGGEVLKEAQL